MTLLTSQVKQRLFGNRKNARLIGVSLAVGVFLGHGFAYAESFSAEDVIRLVQAQNPDAAAAREAVALAEAEAVAVDLYPNPQVGWDREGFPGNSGESEDSLLLTVPVDLSPRRSTRSHLVRAKVATANAHAARTGSAAVVKGLMLFYDLIGEQQRAEIQNRVLDRLKQAAEVMMKRREAGTVSGYEQARVEVETELAASTLRYTRARADRLHKELALILGVDASGATFSGDLGGDSGLVLEPSAGEAAEAASRPSLDLLRRAASESSHARNSASGIWIPDLAISAGPRLRVAGETRYGYVVGLAVDLPVFSRGQGLRAESDASRRAAQARVVSAERAAHIETLRAEHRLGAARKEARQFHEAIRDRIERLEKAAESGYREGQRSIVELLDARRARTTVEYRRLELALSVKRAEVALRAARGDFE